MLNYIFDLDGTIVNSSEEILKCIEIALSKSNVPYDKSKLVPEIIGPPIQNILKIDDENLKSKVIQNFRQAYDNDMSDISSLYCGMKNVLKTLKEHGKKLFIATNKPLKPTLRVLKMLDIDIFDDVYTVDKFAEKMTKSNMVNNLVSKYNLKKGETVIIGDALSDIYAGKQSNIFTMGVVWGYEKDKDTLRKESDFIIEKAEEILCH